MIKNSFSKLHKIILNLYKIHIDSKGMLEIKGFIQQLSRLKYIYPIQTEIQVILTNF
jgi:hypothetical protein